MWTGQACLPSLDTLCELEERLDDPRLFTLLMSAAVMWSNWHLGMREHRGVPETWEKRDDR